MSGLPSGYTQLEYIRSSGTQYVNTGVVETSNTTIDLDLEVEQILPHYIYGVQQNSGSYAYNSIYQNNLFEYNYADLSFTQTARIKMQQRIADGTMYATINGVTLNRPIGVPIPDTILIFAIRFNNGNVRLYPAAVKLYAFSIKKSGTLVRDFVPCKNDSGAVGLYDTVGARFYANAGTGSFTAGPEVVYEPDAPTNFAASVSGQTVALSWAASANAAGYRLKRDGVQIADQTGTTYTDTVPDEIALCTYTLTAYNDAGESAAVTLLVLVQLELITDRTRADVENETDKGFYNASDLNRVGAAVEYIAGRVTALGYACPVTVKKDWLTSDAPTASQMEAYRQNIVTLRGQIAVMQSTPDAPASMAGLDYVKANNIEQILAYIDFILQNMPAASRHCGVTVCGSKGVIA